MDPGTSREELLARLRSLTSLERRRLVGALAEDRIRDDPRGAVLTAWVTAAAGGEPDPDDLRAFVRARLPEAMTPGRFVIVREFPRTVAGKIDRAAVRAGSGGEPAAPRSAPHARSGPVPPRTEVERTLRRVWAEVLGLDEESVGVEDDFFELGGDSLLSIRALSRAARAGVTVSPDRFFETPTIRALAEAAQSPDGEAVDDPATAGSAPLTPIQSWFFERITEGRDRWNQELSLAVSDTVDPERLEGAVAELVRRHDGLRLRFARSGPEGWRQVVDPVADRPADGVFRRVRLPSEPVAAQDVLSREADREHADLRLEAGRLFRVLFFEGEGEGEGESKGDGGGRRRLLLLAHHALVDAVSWDVLTDDLIALLAGRQPPRGTASVLTWTRALERVAGSDALAPMADAWLGRPVDPSWVTVPLDHDAEGMGVHASSLYHRVSVELEPTVARGGEAVVDRLVASVVQMLADWTGRLHHQIDLEGLGRTVPGGPDVSRTVGWFTTVFPLAVALPDRSAAAALATVSAERARLPLQGAAWGLLRHLHPDADLRLRLAARPRSRVLFNYLGRRSGSTDPRAVLRVLDGPVGQPRASDAPRAYALEINAWIDGDSLEMTLETSSSLHRDETVEVLVRDLERAVRGQLAGAVEAPPALDLAPLDPSAFGLIAEVLADLDDPEGG